MHRIDVVRERETVSYRYYTLRLFHGPGLFCCWLDVKENGEPIWDIVSPEKRAAAKEIYQSYGSPTPESRPEAFEGPYVTRYTIPRTIRCTCGEEVDMIDHMTNTCHSCGRYYDGNGNGILPPRMWDADCYETTGDIEEARWYDEW